MELEETLRGIPSGAGVARSRDVRYSEGVARIFFGGNASYRFHRQDSPPSFTASFTASREWPFDSCIMAVAGYGSALPG
jgi:hypothetical protein